MDVYLDNNIIVDIESRGLSLDSLFIQDEIRDYLKYLDDLKYSKTTISRILSTLRHFYSYLVIHKKIEKNNFKLIRNPKKEKKLPNFLQGDELEKILFDLNNYAILFLLLI